MYPTAAITPIAHSVPQPPPLLQQQQREGEGAATSPGRQPRPLTAPLHLQDLLPGLVWPQGTVRSEVRRDVRSVPGITWVFGRQLSLRLLLRKVGTGLVPTP